MREITRHDVGVWLAWNLPIVVLIAVTFWALPLSDGWQFVVAAMIGVANVAGYVEGKFRK